MGWVNQAVFPSSYGQTLRVRSLATAPLRRGSPAGCELARSREEHLR